MKSPLFAINTQESIQPNHPFAAKVSGCRLGLRSGLKTNFLPFESSSADADCS
jgi:hypothetical protein